ncbi:GNAT family N-acetyltransferase [Microbispora sp. ATCC PTA-5024]|uniref:GNAT family N-acetyltransferase n=1 Tax=Microbispora sp. ATCC PTA-5024 TaxID=316330 RepID=UPI001E5B504C|nr:GNAT family N-acetyltransferase [Microbispora sp. ATCC PTA-5024]
MIQLRRVGPDTFITVIDTVLDIYTEAMRPPTDQLTGRLAIMRNHATYPDFVCLLAESPDIVGFAYGFHGAPGQWWHDVVRRALQDQAGTRAAQRWFGDALEIAEVHVRPDYQGKGIGRSLIHAICEGRPERTAVLSTHDAPTAARHLYGDVGFVDLLTRFVFPGGYENYVIAGVPLPLPPQR